MTARARHATPAGVLAVAVVATLTAILSGCLLPPAPRQPQIGAKALPPGTTIPPQWASATDSADVANDWLGSFNDPHLDALVAEAIAHNLDLRQAAALVAIARQTVVVVAAQLKPQIGLNLNVARTKIEGLDGWEHSDHEFAGMAWELDVWGRLRAQRDAAEASYQATALDYAFARQSLAATTASSWYLAIANRQLVALAEQSVAIYSRLLRLAKIRRAAGKVSDLDVAEAAANLSAAQGQLRIAQGLSSAAQRNLEVLLGRYPAAELDVADSFRPVPPPVQAGLPSSLLARRPDVIAAEREVVAAFRIKQAARLALLPSFSLNLEGGHLSDGILTLLRLDPWAFRGVLGAYVPIYQGGALLAQVKIATAKQQRALAGYGSAMLQAFREVEHALTNERLLAERLQFQQDEVGDRVEAVRIATVQYKAGAIDLLSLLQLQGDQLGSQANLIKLQNAQLANRIDLHLALGGSFDVEPAVTSTR